MIFYIKILPLIFMFATAAFAIINFNQLTNAFKIVAIICTFNFIAEIVGIALAYQNIKNAWLYNIADVVRFTLWFIYFYLSFNKVSQKKYAVVLVIGYLLIYILINFYQPILLFQTISFVTGGILLLTCCFIFLFNEYKSNSPLALKNNPHFWVALGLLIYHALNLPFIGLYNWLIKNAYNFTKIYFNICVIGSSLVLSLIMLKAIHCSLWNKKFGI